MTSHRAGRKRNEEARARVRAVLATPEGALMSHEAVGELAKCNKNMVSETRRELGLMGGPRKRKPQAPRTKKPKPALVPAPVALPLSPDQGELLTRVYDVALGGTNTLRLLEIRGLLKTRVGQQLREAAEVARKAGAA